MNHQLAPSIDYQYRKEAYTAQKVEQMVEKESKAHFSVREKKRIERQQKRYLRNLQKLQN